MSHRDSVTAPPPGLARHGVVGDDPDRRVRGPERGFYGVQFHPEVVHTPQGQQILESFLYDVAARVRRGRRRP